MRIPLLLFAALWAVGIPAPDAATLYVDPDGQLKTVQAAIEAATSGDTLVLAAATYTENPIVQFKDLLLRAAAGAEVIIDGGPGGGGPNAGSTLRTVESVVQLEDLTLRNALALNVGAGVMVFGGHLQMRRCRLENNSVGALSVTTSVPGVLELEDCDVIGNDVGIEGSLLTRLLRTRIEGNLLGVRCRGEVDFREVDVIGNGMPSLARVGALSLGGSFGRLEKVRVRNNWSNNVEGGIWLSFGPFELVDCDVENNTATNGSAGIAFDLVNSATLLRCNVRNNTAGGEFLGVAGLLVRRASVVATQCTFEDNHSEDSGGGVSVQVNSRLQLLQSQVLRNVSEGKGGGLFVSASDAHLDEVALAGNAALAGGGIAAEAGGTLTLLRSTLASNEAPVGAGVFLLSGPAILERSIIAFHPGAAIFCQADARLACVDLFGNADDSPCGTIHDNLLAVDPLFCNLEPGGAFDLRLRSDSPLAEAGNECGRIGAFPVGCDGVGLESTTWGEFKARYNPKPRRNK